MEHENKKYSKIYIGIATILLSPVIGLFLFYAYINFVSIMLKTDSTFDMFLFSCIFAVAIFGLSIVIIGCNEKQLQHKNIVNN